MMLAQISTILILALLVFGHAMHLDESGSCSMSPTVPYDWLPVTAVVREFISSSLPDTSSFCATDAEDIDPGLLEKVALYAFGFEMNSYTEDVPSYPIQGVMVTEHEKFVFPIIVEKNDIKVKTLAVYEPTCSSVYLSVDTLYAVGFSSNLRGSNIMVNGHSVGVKKAHEAAHHVNIIGQSFLSDHSVLLRNDQDRRTVHLLAEEM